MSSRLTTKIERLTDLLQAAFATTGVVVDVHQAYVAPQVNGAEPNTFNEGRSALISLPSALYGSNLTTTVATQFIPAILGAQFDWVQRVNDTVFRVSVTQDQCSSDLDIIFVLDGSGSIEMTQFGGATGNFQNRILKFVEDVVANFNVGVNGTHVGVVTFASSTTVNMHLNDHFNKVRGSCGDWLGGHRF